MADAPKLLGTDTLRTAYPKVNMAIDNANEALNKATIAETNSINAVNTANSVQSQLNQIVIEGDSSVEAAQARVDADGNVFTTLKERLDTKEIQFANEIGILSNFIGDSTILGISPQTLAKGLKDRGVNVKDFGAIGDGQSHPLSEKFATLAEAQVKYPHATSLSDEIDWCAIQGAINYANANNMNIVYLPTGRYIINREIKPKSYMTLCGSHSAGMFVYHTGTVLYVKDNANVNAIRGEAGVQYVTIQDIQINGNKANQTGISYGIYLDDSDPMETTWNIVRCYIHRFKNGGIYVGTNRRGVSIAHSVVLENDGNGITLKTSDCKVYYSASGLNLGDGIRIEGWVNVVDGCGIFWNKVGIGLSPTAQFCSITNNSIDRNNRQGIVLQGAYNSVVGNTFRINSQEVDSLYAHIDVFDTTGTNTVIGNTFGHDSDTTYPKKTSYDVFLQSNASVTFIGNVRASNASRHGVSNDKKRLYGYSAEKVRSGIATFNGDGGSVKIINHGLGLTPSYFSALPASSDAGAAGIKYVTCDSVNMFVYFNTPPANGTNNVLISWKVEA